MAIADNLFGRGVGSGGSGNVSSDEVQHIKALSQSEYDALDAQGLVDEYTLYLITG